jgi:hypothetical protein
MIEKINSLLSGLDGIIRTPGPSLGNLMENKKWVPYFVFILLTVMILSFVTFPYAADQMSEILQDSNLADYFQDQNFDFRSLSFGQKMFILIPELVFIFIVIGVGAFFTYLFFGIGGAEGLYINYFAIVTGASLIDIVFPKMVETVSLIFNVKLLGLLSPAVLIPGGDAKSFIHIFVSRFDIFSVWYTIAIALGIAYFSKLDIKKSMTISVIYLIFKALVISGFSFLFLSMV